MDIVWSLQLESFTLTKLTKPFVPVNLVGPQVSLQPRWVPASRGSIHFLCVIRRHFRWVRADSGGNVFFAKYGGPSGGSLQSGGKRFFSQNTLARPVGPCCQLEESFFGRVKLEYPRLKKKHGSCWMDIQRPLLLEPCVDYKLTKPCIRVNSFF